MQKMKRLLAFDLDGTLADSKQVIDAEMGRLLARLTHVAKVAVISGGDWPQFESQLLANLPSGADLSRLYLMPTSGTKLYRHGAGWKPVYADGFTPAERSQIMTALAAAAAEFAGDQSWGDKIEDRGSQITFSGLGQHAPLEAKQAWDSDGAKRNRLRLVLAEALPAFAIRTGGSTSIDITRAGVDKAYGMRKLADAAKVELDEILFVGDAIYSGGNDEPVREAGMATIAVAGPSETKRVIEAVTLWVGYPDSHQVSSR
jgi:hypothetical protein